MIHQLIHVEELLQQFGDEEFKRMPDSITGPGPLAAALRHMSTVATSSRDRITDVFLWREGPPEDPRTTCVGGRPFRPKGLDWPYLAGSPMLFAGQLSFVDSLDLTPHLPGDIMQVFSVGVERASDELRRVPLDEMIQVQWVDSSELTPLTMATEGELPAPVCEEFHRAFHGVRVRVSERHPETSGYALAATKIGGFPTDFYQQLDPRFLTDTAFIGQLGRVLPPPDMPYSLVDRADLLCHSKWPWPMNTAGPGMMCFFLNPAEELSIYISSNG